VGAEGASVNHRPPTRRLVNETAKRYGPCLVDHGGIDRSLRKLDSSS